MKYYKLINDTTVIGVASSFDFRAFQHKHGILLISDEQKGEYLQCDKSLYRDNWMRPMTTDTIPYKPAKVIAIGEEEYIALKSAIEKEGKIDIESQEEQPDAVISEENANITEALDITIEFVKASKRKEMSVACQKAITDGFDVALSDGETQHFSLTVHDQLNLLTLSAAVSAGETEIPYHADGQPCRYYSAEDITAIISAADRHKNYHTTYYNSLRAYINSLSDITAISTVVYGMEIPAEYRSEVLSGILENEGEQVYGS